MSSYWLFFPLPLQEVGFEGSSPMAWPMLGTLLQHSATTTITITLITVFTLFCFSNLAVGRQEIDVQHLDEDGRSTAESRQDAAAAGRSVGRLAFAVSSVGLATASSEAMGHQSELSKEHFNMCGLKFILWVSWRSCVRGTFSI